jgi:signal transduction histidine kinase
MDAPADARWPKILSLSVHEFRTPMTVVAGYVRMLLKERAGALNEQQRHLLEETEKSCGRLSALLAEVSELSTLEAGTATFNKQSIDLNAVLRTAVDRLEPLRDREIAIDLQLQDGDAPISGDPVKLAQAVGAVIAALRRELVTTDRMVVKARRGPAIYEIFVGDETSVQILEAQPGSADATFDEWRGGVGLSLLNARRILNAHGGAISSSGEGRKTDARITILSS